MNKWKIILFSPNIYRDWRYDTIYHACTLNSSVRTPMLVFRRKVNVGDLKSESGSDPLQRHFDNQACQIIARIWLGRGDRAQLLITSHIHVHIFLSQHYCTKYIFYKIGMVVGYKFCYATSDKCLHVYINVVYRHTYITMFTMFTHK